MRKTKHQSSMMTFDALDSDDLWGNFSATEIRPYSNPQGGLNISNLDEVSGMCTKILLLMAEIRHPPVEVGSLSHYSPIAISLGSYMDKAAGRRPCTGKIFTQDVPVLSRSCLGRVSVVSR